MKTYKLKTNGQEHTVSVKDAQGKRHALRFVKLIPNAPFAYLMTSDANLQGALENSDHFKNGLMSDTAEIVDVDSKAPVLDDSPELTADDDEAVVLVTGETNEEISTKNEVEDAPHEEISTKNIEKVAVDVENSTNFAQAVAVDEDKTTDNVEESTNNEEKTTDNVEIATVVVEKATNTYHEVTTHQQAKAVLVGDPYNVSRNSHALRTPEGIVKKAAELAVYFPNLAAISK
jgi:hypothetical protein